MANILTLKDNGFKNIKFTETSKLSFKFDLETFNMIIGYIFKDSRSVTKKSLNNLYKLLEMTDESIYFGAPELEERLKFLRKCLEGKVKEKLETKSSIIAYTREVNNTIRDTIIEKIPVYERMSLDEVKFINKLVEERLKYSFTEDIFPKMAKILELKSSGLYKKYSDITEPMIELAKELILRSRMASTIDEVEEFSLLDDSFDSIVDKLVDEFNNPAKILYTGIKELNTLLSPGYLAGRLYTYLGLPAGFKSGILLKALVDIRKYNKKVKLKDPSKIPCALLITMENTVVETIERLYNMTTDGEGLDGLTAKQIVKKLKNEGELNFKGNGDINLVIRYYPNMAISTDDIYTIIDDLADDGQEVVAMVLDYIKRIRPSRKAKDEKEELKNVTNELKNIAIHYTIPVITAHQLNRESARIIDTANINNRGDATNEIGRTHTGSAWEVIENSDWACVINIYLRRVVDENGIAKEEYYLTFKRVKIRYKPLKIDSIFSHPFENGNRIKLTDDVYLAKSLSIQNPDNNMQGTEKTPTNKARRSVKNRMVNMTEDDDVDEYFNYS